MKIKRSEMKAKLLEPWATYQHGGAAEAYAERILAEMEEAGLTWEPEAPEWPGLVVVGTRGGCMLGARGGLTDDEKERIARAWNARRPGGEMDKRLRSLVGHLIKADEGGEMLTVPDITDRIEAALRLGVEGE